MLHHVDQLLYCLPCHRDTVELCIAPRAPTRPAPPRGGGRSQAVLCQQIGAVVEDADVHVPRHAPHAVAPGGGRPPPRGSAAPAPRAARREVEQPAGLGELRGDPRPPPATLARAKSYASSEVDHVELMLLVAGPRGLLRYAPSRWDGPPRTPAADRGSDREGPKQLGVLEHQRDRTARFPASASARSRRSATRTQRRAAHTPGAHAAYSSKRGSSSPKGSVAPRRFRRGCPRRGRLIRSPPRRQMTSDPEEVEPCCY